MWNVLVIIIDEYCTHFIKTFLIFLGLTFLKTELRSLSDTKTPLTNSR